MKRIFIITLILLIVTGFAMAEWQAKEAPLMTRWAKDVDPESVHQEYPRPQMVREKWLNLNGMWQFEKYEQDTEPQFGKELSREILVPFVIESALSGVMEKTHYITYRHTFEIPKNWKKDKVLIHFGAVDFDATVYLNGTEIGSHRGGYNAFTFDLTSVLKSKGEQELIVKVYDPTDDGVYPRGKQVEEPGGIFYTSVTGIWQTVWLEAVPKTYIESFKMNPDIDKNLLNLNFNVVNAKKKYSINITAFQDGKKISEKTIDHKSLSENCELKISDPVLWTPENPFLYDLKIKLLKGKKVIDEIDSYFAMRKISLGKDKQNRTVMMLNNEYVFHNGPLDQGYWPDGLYTAPTDEALKYDIEIAKELGFNMIRKHAKVEPERWYYWTDKLGMLVWQDMPQVNPDEFEARQTEEHKKQFEYELHEMVDQFYNYPSIVMWVIFNEAWGQYDTERLTAAVKKQDPNRLVSNASGWTDKEVGDILDWHLYPGPGSPKPEETRAAVLGEFGGLGLQLKGHLWQEDNWGYQNFENKTTYQDRYELLYDDVWALEKNPGMSACVYTQITDVEMEVNGLLTYDREIIKFDKEDFQAIHSDKHTSVPRVVPNGGIFLNTQKIELKNRKGEEIRYTLDGSNPTENSLLYKEPITIKKSTEIKVRSFAKSGRKSGLTVAKFEKTTLLKPVKIKNPKQGLNYSYYEGKWDGLPDFSKEKPVKSGITNIFDLTKRDQDDWIGFEFTGYVKVEKDGIYTFYTESDDGSCLYVNDKLVVNNDGFHGMREYAGQIALKAGLHPIRVPFFEGGIEEGLIVRYSGPGLEKQEIPAKALYQK